MAVAFNPDTRRRLAGAARLLLSDKPGEVVAALNAIGRMLPAGITVPDLIEQSLSPVVVAAAPVLTAPSPVNLDPAWRRRARFARYSPHINDWECGFLGDVIGWQSLSQRQEATLKAILVKSEGGRS